ncbi:antibiotic biosynthesis monooxygenase [Tranquillimonas alkanivorans]|uniref:antibiotic biosynthesis monooxygenase n=1 Tax=Tranquillimonas alkanivorans TaxID=441119 RepID=UPI000B891942|nr:antibiotic biosynthesis monooxygenase [Tranquillimonas alkanivorans]
MFDAKMLNKRPGTMLFALRVSREDADVCAEKLAVLNERLVRADGFISLDVIRRNGGLGTDFFVLIRFTDVDSLEAWRGSRERANLVSEIERMAIVDISRQQVAGSNIWFEPITSMPSPIKPPKLWKRWVTSMLAVYPALIVLVKVMEPLTDRLPVELGLFMVALVLTGLTTAFIVPWLTRILQPWLSSR